MPFGLFKSLGESLRAFQIVERVEEFVKDKPFSASEALRSWLEVSMREFPVECSEFAVCENLIFPILREVSIPYSKALTVWSHMPLCAGDQLLGIPDYMIAKRSPLSVHVLDTPFAMIMEAKRNDFDAGWGQCIAAMVAAQKINADPKRVIYGCVTDGFVWRYGKMREQVFFRDPQSFVLDRVDNLLGALNHVLDLCKQQVLSPAEAA